MSVEEVLRRLEAFMKDEEEGIRSYYEYLRVITADSEVARALRSIVLEEEKHLKQLRALHTKGREFLFREKNGK